MDIRLALMCGTDFPIEECQLIIHQPSIKEISFIGEEKFFIGVQCFCISKEFFKDNFITDDINNFQIFMTIMNDENTVDKRENVKELLNLLFPNNKIIFTPQSIIFQNEERNIVIDNTNFDFLATAIKSVGCIGDNRSSATAFNPGSKKAQEIADKINRGRKIVAEQKGEVNASIFSRYLSILTVGLNSTSLTDLMNLTIFQIYDLIERFNLYTNWDLDIRSRLAGGKPENKPDDWMKNIH